ncbi:MAG: permease [Chloroflexota bacterium]
MKRKTPIFIGAYAVFLLISWLTDFRPGKEISLNFASFALTMLSILPFAFVLIGLFEVWVRRETVERHFGVSSGLKGYLWAILLAGTTVGGLYVAFPVAWTLYNKGARLGVILTLVSAAAVCRIPMALFEASFLGFKFTAIRFLVSLPLILLSSSLMGSYLEKHNYRMTQPNFTPAAGKRPPGSR